MATALGCAPGDIADFDVQLTDCQPSTLGGACDEFIFSGRLDNLCSCFTSLAAFLTASTPESLATASHVRMIAHFDHEEVGSASSHGAASPVMADTVRRVAAALAGGEEGVVERALRSSFLVSADMAHGVHPNYADKHDPAHAPKMHAGLVIKHNANQRACQITPSGACLRALTSCSLHRLRHRRSHCLPVPRGGPRRGGALPRVRGPVGPGLRLHHRPHHRQHHRHARRRRGRPHAQHAQRA